MTDHDTILLTGITGSVGSWMARTILEDGGRVVAVVRAESEPAAAARIRNAMAIVGTEESADRIIAVCGDICDPEFARRGPRKRDADFPHRALRRRGGISGRSLRS
jgi:nucleoside-diphosphate-sugar epimerase